MINHLNKLLIGPLVCCIFASMPFGAAAADPEKEQASEMQSIESIPLWPDKPPHSDPSNDFRPQLDIFPTETETPVGAVLICPGGGYGGRAAHEGAPIARRFNEAGFHAFVVQYRVAPHRHPAPLLDAARAIRIIRHRAEEWKVLPDHVAILGFSAGGHLAASLGVHYEAGDPQAADPLARLSSRPDALALCYPVISSGKYGHRGSFQNLLGENPSEDLLQTMSLETQVTNETPPTFLWHTANDGGVPVQNSLLFAEALGAHGVPFELHVYPQGNHGMGLALKDPHVATWSTLCCEWLAGMGWNGK